MAAVPPHAASVDPPPARPPTFSPPTALRTAVPANWSTCRVALVSASLVPCPEPSHRPRLHARHLIAPSHAANPGRCVSSAISDSRVRAALLAASVCQMGRSPPVPLRFAPIQDNTHIVVPHLNVSPRAAVCGRAARTLDTNPTAASCVRAVSVPTLAHSTPPKRPGVHRVISASLPANQISPSSAALPRRSPPQVLSALPLIRVVGRASANRATSVSCAVSDIHWVASPILASANLVRVGPLRVTLPHALLVKLTSAAAPWTHSISLPADIGGNARMAVSKVVRLPFLLDSRTRRRLAQDHVQAGDSITVTKTLN